MRVKVEIGSERLALHPDWLAGDDVPLAFSMANSWQRSRISHDLLDDLAQEAQAVQWG